LLASELDSQLSNPSIQTNPTQTQTTTPPTPTGLAAERGLHDFRPSLTGLSEAVDAEEQEAAAAAATATTAGAAAADKTTSYGGGKSGVFASSSIPLRLALALGDVRRRMAQDRRWVGG
jgi:hypothetical protein